MKAKKFVVVGGSKGIGHAIVTKLISQGYEVCVISRFPDQMVASDLLTYIQKDILTDTFLEGELPDTCDGLVYCPGSITLKPFKSISEQQFLDDFSINVLGAVKTIKANLSALKKSEAHPSIVLFSTVAVAQGMPFHASVAASQGAIEGLIRSLSAELSPTIRVNGIAPSLTNTELSAKLISSPEKIQAAEQRHPLKAIGTPEDIAEAALYLMSENAKWVTGQILHIDGGMSSIKL